MLKLQALFKGTFTVTICFIMECLSLTVKAQFPIKTDMAYDRLLLRVEANKSSDDSYLIKLTPVEKDGNDLKEEVSNNLMEWDEKSFVPVMHKLMAGIWESDTAYDSWIAGKDLDSLFRKVFHRLEAKRFSGSTEMLSQVNYGLTENDLFQLSNLKGMLLDLQDTVKKLKRIQRINAHYTRTPETSEGKKGIKTETWRKENALLPYTPMVMIDSLIEARKVIATEIRRINNRRKFLVSLIGNSNVVSSFKTIDRTEINAGFGILAAKPGFAEFMGVITVAQAHDDLHSDNSFDFGQTVLVPGVRKFSLLTTYRTYSLFRYSSSLFLKKVGGGLDFNVTPYRWANATDTIRVVPYAMNALLPITWVLNVEPGRDFAISTDLGLTLRYIGGDASDNQIETFLGTQQRVYVGFLAGINIKYNALRAQFHAPFLNGNSHVEGLTHGQVYASIGIVGNLVNDLAHIIKGNNGGTAEKNRFINY
jgi:hypothetical protein